MEKKLNKIYAKIDALEAEFKANDNKLQGLKSNRASAEYCELHDRQMAINNEIHNLLEQSWALTK